MSAQWLATLTNAAGRTPIKTLGPFDTKEEAALAVPKLRRWKHARPSDRTFIDSTDGKSSEEVGR